MKLLSLNLPGNYDVNAPAGIPTGGSGTLTSIIRVGLNWILMASVLLALIFIIWGAIDWVTSEGDKQRVNQARQKITFAVIGLAIAFVSVLIINIVNNLFRI